MKLTITTLITTAILFSLSGSALAEGSKGKKFKQTDTNGDGLLSRSELQAKQDKRLDDLFSNADSNNDGFISKEEMRSHRKNKKKDRHY